MNTPERSSLPEGFHTHEVTNQPSDLSPYDAWATDTPLREAIIREGGGWAEADIARYGPLVGGEMMELARQANEIKPKFKPFACYGQRIDEVEFHPAYHRIMALGIEHGVPSYAWLLALQASVLLRACGQSSGCGCVLRIAVRSGAWSGFWYLACARADGRADRARVPGRLKRP